MTAAATTAAAGFTIAGHPWWLLPVDIGAWAVAHAGTGYVAHRLPQRVCERDNWLTRIRDPERTERRCRRFGVPRWKDALPESGAFFAGGVSKRHLRGSGSDALREFAALTRRAEMAHWMAFLVSPVFALWNPPWIAAVMVVYGAAVNAPFIAIQRYNRVRVRRILSLRDTRPVPSRGSAASEPSPSDRN